MKSGYPTGSSDFTTREFEIFHISGSDCTDIYRDMNLSLVSFKVPLRRKFLLLFSPFSCSNPFNEFVITKIAIN